MTVTASRRFQPMPDRPRGRLSVDEFCFEMSISRRTFYEWRAKGRAPRCMKLPNGDLRISRADFESWLDDCYEKSA